MTGERPTAGAHVDEPLPFAYDGPPALQMPLLAALNRVVDPELALSIVDLGLIYSVRIDATGAAVRMTMTSAACPVAEQIVDEVEFELESLVSTNQTIQVELCWEPAWTPDRMSVRARRFMG